LSTALQRRREHGVAVIGIEGCCARSASGHAATAPPSSVMDWRRFALAFIRSPRRRGEQRGRPVEASIRGVYPARNNPYEFQMTHCLPVTMGHDVVTLDPVAV
jgi:hypothetical protein